jgi:NAD(P)H-hydrate epimerase
VIPVFSREESRAFDERAIAERHVPSVVLMENAGRGVVDAFFAEWPGPAPVVVVVSGPGNNGGDGFVAARHLALRGASVRVFLVGEVARVTGDARVHLDAMRGVGVALTVLEDGLGDLAVELRSATHVIDALFGTGLTRPVEAIQREALEAIQHAGKPVVAVDVPSGLDANTGATLGCALRATLTVTFAARKLGLLTPQGAQLAGKVVVADIGVTPPSASESAARLLTGADVAALLVPRAVGAFKNTAGHVVIFAGSPGHVGAALMCAHGAFRAGAGLVTIATWGDVQGTLDQRVTEAMTVRLDREQPIEGVDAALARAKVVVLGPGFGKDDAARRVVRHVLSEWQGPSVLDADALAMFPGEIEVFASSKGAAVLTPHPGELGVLLGSSSRAVEADRFEALREGVLRSRSVTLLKGAHTLVGAPDEGPVVIGAGSPALGTAGSGDVLSGTIAALACSLDPFEAAFVGAHLHGSAGEAWARAHGDRGLLAHEIADEYPKLIADYVRECEPR